MSYRLKTVDRVTVRLVADLLDAGRHILDRIDMRHYYGPAKADTKAVLYTVDAQLRGMAAQLRQVADESEEHAPFLPVRIKREPEEVD